MTDFNRLAQELAQESIQMFGKDKAASKQPLGYHMLIVSEIAEASECARLNQLSIFLDEAGKASRRGSGASGCSDADH